MQRLTTSDLATGILQGDRARLGRAITLAESTRPEDQQQTVELVEAIWPYAGRSLRIGITGVPGVGKSTFIEAFGSFLTQLGKRVAVLSIDPTSPKSGGSILGDKTRMESLARNPNAFIRPSASGAALSGVTTGTREAILFCEAAGFDVILVETVGAGQLEASLRHLVDFYLLLLLAGAGDELQGIKRGIMELADAWVLTKDDGDNQVRVAQARAELAQALHLFAPHPAGVEVPLLSTSALQAKGMEAVWRAIEHHIQSTRQSGYFQQQRNDQLFHWLQEALQQQLLSRLQQRKQTPSVYHEKILRGELTPPSAARQWLAEAWTPE